MMKEFRDFVVRGNVVDLAIGIIETTTLFDMGEGYDLPSEEGKLCNNREVRIDIKN